MTTILDENNLTIIVVDTPDVIVGPAPGVPDIFITIEGVPGPPGEAIGLGDLSTLTTTDKSSAVAAINELNSYPKIVEFTQAEFDALSSINPNILYVIVG